MKHQRLLLTLATFAAMSFGAPNLAGASEIKWCDSGKTITFAGVDWESGAFIREVIERLLSDGYGCKVDSIPGNTLTLEQATADGQVQIFAEDWIGRSEVLEKAIAAGKTIPVGHPFVGAGEGWFVPEFVVKGDSARGIAASAPDLKSVDQLSDPDIVKLFTDPEEPGKGRFLNCPSGWTCEGVSTAKLQAYKLDELYTNFRPGTGIALDAEITSKISQGEPVLFYYWSPTAIMGKFKLVQLEEPAYTKECWDELTKADGKRDSGCAFPAVEVIYSLNREFHDAAPEIVDILKKAEFPLEKINTSVAYMVDNKAEAAAAAEQFLKENSDLWGQWVSADAKKKVLDSLQ